MMNRCKLNEAFEEIHNFKDKLGENFFDAIMEDDNSTYEMAHGIISAFNNCETEREFEIANDMLTGCCGYGFEMLVDRIKEQDKENHQWMSC